MVVVSRQPGPLVQVTLMRADAEWLMDLCLAALVLPLAPAAEESNLRAWRTIGARLDDGRGPAREERTA